MQPPRWMIRRDLKAQGFDPMLAHRRGQPRGGKSWCAECGLYFNSASGYDRHFSGSLGSPERRCLTCAELRSSGWTQGAKGHWLRPGAPANHWQQESPVP